MKDDIDEALHRRQERGHAELPLGRAVVLSRRVWCMCPCASAKLCGLKLHKIKRPAGDFAFDVELVAEDEFGVWLSAPSGSAWRAPHDAGTLPMDVLLLLSQERFWVAWWVDDPADRRLEIDVCLRPERVRDGWAYVDLELDPVRHEGEGALIEVEDHDEFEIACREGWIAALDAEVALTTAAALEAALRERVEPLGGEGWMRLDALRGERRGRSPKFDLVSLISSVRCA